MSDAGGKALVIGYGNPGRLDDGLGPALADALEALHLAGVTVDADYQLTVEHAAAVAAHDVVVFADAAVRGGEPFSFAAVEPRRAVSFTSHSVDPEAVMALARDLFGATTKGYALAIRGHRFDEFGESLSPGARANLAEALRFLVRLLRKDVFRKAQADPRHLAPGGGAGWNEDRTCKTAST